MKYQRHKNNYLYEGLDYSASHSMMLWESAGFKLKEAALTADQIQQIFQNVEQGATAAGGNRTVLGKGKDAAVAVNKAWEDLKTKIQNSGPIAKVDSAYDSAVSKIEAGLGGPDNAINKVIQKYRKFAKDYPVAQGFIYAALIAAAGISGAGLGGAAVLGLLKMTDKLLQGEKFSNAGKMANPGISSGSISGDPMAGVSDGSKGLMNITGSQGSQAQRAMYQAIEADPSLAKNSSALADIYYDKLQDLNPNLDTDFLRTKAEFAATKLAAGAGESIAYTGKKLSEGQIYMIFNRVSEQQQLTEGPMDFIKGAAAKGMAKLQTVGKNLTTKVTADKLNSAWKKAGSPMDSEEVAKILTAAGVGDDVVKQVYTDLKISAAPAAQASASSYVEIKKSISQLNTKDRQRMIAYLTKQIGTA
jgi:hypothetical protein